MSSKTEQTLKALAEKCKQIKYGEWLIKLYIFNQQIVGFDEIDRPIIKFRASKKVEDMEEEEG